MTAQPWSSSLAKSVGELFGGEVGARGDQSHICLKAVSNGEKTVFTVIEGKGADEIHGNRIATVLGSGIGV